MYASRTRMSHYFCNAGVGQILAVELIYKSAKKTNQINFNSLKFSNRMTEPGAGSAQAASTSFPTQSLRNVTFLPSLFS